MTPRLAASIGRPRKGKSTSALTWAAEEQAADGRMAVGVGGRLVTTAREASVEWPVHNLCSWYEAAPGRAVLEERNAIEVVRYLWETGEDEAPYSVIVVDEAPRTLHGKEGAALLDKIGNEYRHTRAHWMLVHHCLSDFDRQLQKNLEVLICHHWTYGYEEAYYGRRLARMASDCDPIGEWPEWHRGNYAETVADPRMCHGRVVFDREAALCYWEGCNCRTND